MKNWKLLQVIAKNFHSYDTLRVDFDNVTFIQGMCSGSRLPLQNLLRFIRDLFTHLTRPISNDMEDFLQLIEYCFNGIRGKKIDFEVKVQLDEYIVQYHGILSYQTSSNSDSNPYLKYWRNPNNDNGLHGKLLLHSELIKIYTIAQSNPIWVSEFNASSEKPNSFFSSTTLKPIPNEMN